ncbi:MAG TPA: hypothetical protein VII69_06810 [Candidatus Eremiobacteraceae bacterium]
MTTYRATRNAITGLAVAGILFGALSPAAATCFWQSGPLPNDGAPPTTPFSLLALSANDIWAANNGDRELLHWNGSAWSEVTIPVNTPPDTGLFSLAVTGTSDSDLWIDAIFRSESDQYAKSIHFDGNRWTVTRMPTGFPPSKICPGQGDGPNISAMQAFSPTDVWSAGEVCHIENGKSIFEGISEHWDGVRWNILPFAAPLKFLPFGLPEEMSGTSDHDIWVLGEQSVIEHFNGRRWAIASGYGALNALIDGVFAGSPDDAWAVGFVPKTGDPGSQTRTFAAHWNGRDWEQFATPNEDGPNFERANALRAVSGSAPNDVWAVGETDKPGSPNHNARLQVMHWNGVNWSNHTSAQLGAGGFYSVVDLGVRDVWALGGDNPNSGSSNPIASFRCSAGASEPLEIP